MRVPGYGFTGFTVENGKTYAVCRSMNTGNDNRFEVTDDQADRIQAWLNGEGLIQSVLYDLSADHREMLMTGCTDREWDEMFDEPSSAYVEEDDLLDPEWDDYDDYSACGWSR